MSIPATAPSLHRPARRFPLFLRIFLTFVAAAVLGGSVFFGWLFWLGRSALPQMDGSIRLDGLTAAVQVSRDAQGVPHIAAPSVEDMLFAQGFVTAQDRLWQMDMARRYARGELAEVFGPTLLPIDERQRTLRYDIAVKSSMELLSARDLRYLQSYAAGINAAMNIEKEHLPIEFRLLRYSPQPWTPEDSFYVATNMVADLNGTWKREWQRERVLAKLSPADRADLYPNSSWRDHPPSATLAPEASEQGPSSSSQGHGTNHFVSIGPGFSEPEMECDECRAGSNNWVVSGAHTASGRPLLSNDMHLGHSIPDVWYEVHLQGGDYDVAGVSLPGVPFVIVGHNRRIAWGFTNLGPDVLDLFTEESNAEGEYRSAGGWQKPERLRENIKVKGGPDRPLDLITTRHGPVITSLLPGEHRTIALRWTLYDGLRFRFYEIGTARNWDEFRQAFSRFDAPSQNVVYADVDGHIGYQATGKIPIRRSGDGLVPVSGDGSFDWTGYVPFDRLPSVFDPPSGILGTANGRITPDGYPYLLANEWGSPYRTERIYKVLRGGARLTSADMLALQMDVYSQFDKTCADSFVYAVDHEPHASIRAKQVADLLRGWNGMVTVDSVAPTIVTHARASLTRILLQPKLGPMWKQYQWFDSSVALENMLVSKPQSWVPSGFKDFDAVLAAAVEDAVNAHGTPAELSDWTWGKVSRVEVQHPIFGKIPGLASWTGTGSHPQSGNASFTVKAASPTFGASERMTVDLADLDRSTLNIVIGQSGQLLSPHYMDQFNAWYRGSTFPLPFTPAAVQAAARHRLTLLPESAGK